MIMPLRTTLAMALTLFAVPTAAAAGEPATPAHTIILIGADWCAPCVAELRDLPALARAAAPARLVLAWTDHSARLPVEAVQLGVTQVSAAMAREMVARYDERHSGLPMAVMLRNDGTACGMLRQRLSREGIAAMLRSCGEG
jgi:hypothetical protein